MISGLNTKTHKQPSCAKEPLNIGALLGKFYKILIGTKIRSGKLGNC